MSELKCPADWLMLIAVSSLSPVNTHTCKTCHTWSKLLEGQNSKFPGFQRAEFEQMKLHAINLPFAGLQERLNKYGLFP